MRDRGRLGIRILGELAASRDGAALDLGGPRQRAVLALLVLARGETVPAERIVDALWAGSPPPTVAGTLQSYVSHLRRRLEPDRAARARSGVIVSEASGYALRLPPDAIDAWRFEAALESAATAGPDEALAALRGALALWRGPALAEYADEPWAEAEAARLTDLRAVARERLLAARLACGESALLVPELEALVAEEPLREERWRLLTLALYRGQRQADALAALRRARAVLADELGVDPGPALRELEAQVLAQAPELDLPAGRRDGPPAAPAAASPAAEGSDAAPPGDRGGPDPRPSTPPGLGRPAGPAPAGDLVPAPRSAPGGLDELVDRERELAEIETALDDLARGEPALLLIEGPAGIGKSRLLAEARRRAAARGLRVLAARGSQMERAFGFGAVRQLLEPTVARAEGDPFPGAAAAARGVFGAEPAGATDGSFAVLHGLYWMTVSLAERAPLVLAVDDLQWLDTASLRYLGYLVRRLEGLPVLVVATLRTGETHDEDDLLAEVALDPLTRPLRPGPLSAEAVATVLARHLGAEPAPLFIDACHTTTGGNPLLLGQVVRALAADRVRPDAAHADRLLAIGSRAVAGLVLLRLRRLPPAAPRVARALAVLGDGADLATVAALAGLPDDAAAAGLADLVRAALLRPEQPLGFAHPLLRDAVYADVPAPERALEHERAARLLESRGAPVEQVAAHLLLAPRRGDPAVVALLRRAARTATDRGAVEGAVTALRRALEEPPPAADRLDVLTDLGMLEARLDGPACTRHLMEVWERSEDPRRRAEVAAVVTRTLVFASPHGVASAFARRAREALPPEVDDARQGLLALQRITAFMHDLDLAEWHRDDPGEPRGDGPGALSLAAALAWEAVCEARDRERAVRLARQALAGDRLWHHDDGLLWLVAAIARIVADDDLGDFWTRARVLAHSRGSLFAALSTNLWSGYWQWRRGELDEALGLVRDAREQSRMWGGNLIGEITSRGVLVGINLDRGDLAAAEADADLDGAEEGMSDGGRGLASQTVRYLLATGDPGGALRRVERLDDGRRENPAWHQWSRLRGRALLGLGRRAEARDALDADLAASRAWGAPSTLAASLLSHAAGLDDPAAREADLREALALVAPTDRHLLAARARLALGDCSTVGDPEALPLLRAALGEAVACGATGVVAEARAALARRGETADGAQQCPARLSPTQRRVRDLAEAGHDAHAIAQTLFLTPATVRVLLDGALRDGGRRTPSPRAAVDASLPGRGTGPDPAAAETSRAPRHPRLKSPSSAPQHSGGPTGGAL